MKNFWVARNFLDAGIHGDRNWAVDNEAVSSSAIELLQRESLVAREE